MYEYACRRGHRYLVKNHFSDERRCCVTISPEKHATQCDSCRKFDPRQEIVFGVAKHHRDDCKGLFQGRILVVATLCDEPLHLIGAASPK